MMILVQIGVGGGMAAIIWLIADALLKDRSRAEERLDVFGEGCPLCLVHDDEHGGGISDGTGVDDIIDDFALLPAFEGFDRAKSRVDDSLLKRLVGFTLAHAEGCRAKTRDDFR